jgi:hypothetical protein
MYMKSDPNPVDSGQQQNTGHTYLVTKLLRSRRKTEASRWLSGSQPSRRRALGRFKVSVNNDAVETEPRLSPLQRHGCAYAGLAGLGFQRLGSTSLTS